MDHTPILPTTGPFFRNIHRCKIEHFQQAFVARKNSFIFCYLTQLSVKGFDRIRCVNQASDRFRILEIGRKKRPVIVPGFIDFWIFIVPFCLKAFECFQSEFFALSGIDTFKCVWQNRNQPVRKLRIQPVGKE